MERAQGVRHHAAQLALVGVDCELGLDMLDVEKPNSLGLLGSAGFCKRRPGLCSSIRGAGILHRQIAPEALAAKIMNDTQR